MRRIVSPVLIGLGTFLLIAAVLIKFYAYPSLAKVPTNYESTTTLEALGAEVFNSDPEVLAPETTDLTIESRTVADSSADAPDGIAVWTNTASIRRGDQSIFQRSNERMAFDEVTGAGVDCESCGSFSESEEGVRTDMVPDGQIYKFPFNTEKKDYQVWDGSLDEATTATFEGEEKLDGLTVYKFVQTIEPTVIDTQDVPGSVFGLDEDVTADMVYAMERTFYVEPITGAPVNRIENRTQELVYDGNAVSAFVGTVAYTDDQVAKSVSDAKEKAPALGGMRLLYPLVAGLLGLLAIAGGLLLRRRDTTTSAKHEDSDRTTVGV